MLDQTIMNIGKLLNLKSYIINMPNEEENYIKCKKELNQHGFMNVNRFISFDCSDEDLLRQKSCELGLRTFVGTNSQQSLALAHLSLFDMLIRSDEESFLIFEDDIIFHTEFDNLIESKIKKIPTFDILYLGSWVIKNSLTDCDFVIKSSGILLTHAYIINKKAAIVILNECRKRYYQAIDQVYNRLMSGILTQISLVHSPCSSKNYKQLRTVGEEMTGLIYQTKHQSSVIIPKRVIKKEWSC